MPRCGNCKYFNEKAYHVCYFGEHHPLSSPCSSWEALKLQCTLNDCDYNTYDYKEYFRHLLKVHHFTHAKLPGALAEQFDKSRKVDVTRNATINNRQLDLLDNSHSVIGFFP